MTNIIPNKTKYFVLTTDQYYGNASKDTNSTCDKMCPTCQGKKVKVVK